MENVVINILAGLGGYTIILFALIKWIGDIQSKKIILLLENSLTREQNIEDSVRSLLSQSFINNQTLFVEKNIKGIQELWVSFPKVRDKMPSFLVYLDVTTKDEYQSILCNSNFRSAVVDWENIKHDVIKNLNSSDIEIIRPFVGEYLWAIFFSYRAFFLRLAILVSKDADLECPIYWKEDEGLKKIFLSIFTEIELENIYIKEVGTLSEVRLAFESKFLTHVHKITSGQVSIVNGAEMAKDILNKVNLAIK